MSELVDIADVSNSLRAIEISVGFLSSTGGNPNQVYKDYLADVLIMDVKRFAPSGLVCTYVFLLHTRTQMTGSTMALSSHLSFYPCLFVY